MQYLRAADEAGLSRIISIQNPYNLLNRSFEVALTDVACREKVGLLAYSPLAFGVLSGKYLHNKQPEQSRLSLFDHYTRYSNPYGKLATEAYIRVAEKYELNPAQMALAFIRQQQFVSATIIGATTMHQLAENIASCEVKLSSECMADIESVFQQYPNPCP